MSDLAVGPDGEPRCAWPLGDELYLEYHDREWGRAETRDDLLFQKICLEGFQAGLAWITVLRKRDAFRRQFADFDPAIVAAYGEPEVEAMLADAGVIRHRGKIESTINNAGRALELIDEFGSLAAYVWSYARPGAEPPRSFGDLPAQTEVSTTLSKDLKKRGWSFVGPTTVYAFMQAMGMVNDHLEGCFVRDACEGERLPVLERYSSS